MRTVSPGGTCLLFRWFTSSVDLDEDKGGRSQRMSPLLPPSSHKPSCTCTWCQADPSFSGSLTLCAQQDQQKAWRQLKLNRPPPKTPISVYESAHVTQSPHLVQQDRMMFPASGWLKASNSVKLPLLSCFQPFELFLKSFLGPGRFASLISQKQVPPAAHK